MPKRSLSLFTCQKCTYQVSKWLGRCPSCGDWNSFSEAQVNEDFLDEDKPQSVTQIIENLSTKERIKTGFNEFDRVLGGGLIPGAMVLLGGEPGIGKSTLLAEVLKNLTEKDEKVVLYVSGEESTSQIAARSKRLGIKSEKYLIYHQTNWQKIHKQIQKLKPDFVVIDSIQTIFSTDALSAPGSQSQVREVTHELMNQIKSQSINCFVIGHVTKDGKIAGPKTLEHMVDTVLHFEGERSEELRILRSIKNRFGKTNEIGVFQMNENGLQDADQHSYQLAEDSSRSDFGRSLTCYFEGSRSLFMEVQALVVDNQHGVGRRTTQGFDNNRLTMLIAVIDKYLGFPLGMSDVYLNMIGSIKDQNRESDLAVIASLLSSYKTRAIRSDTIFIGEVGLTGEIRTPSHLESRLKEIGRLNYKRVITSLEAESFFKDQFPLEIIGLKSIKEVEDHI